MTANHVTHPQAPSKGSGGNRLRLTIVFVLLALLAASTLVVLLVTDHDGESAPLGEAPGDDEPQGVESPDGGEITIIDHGATNLRGADGLSIAVMVTNTSEYVAQNTSGYLTPLNADGERTTGRIDFAIDTIASQQDTAYSETLLASDVGGEAITEISGFEVVVTEVGSWSDDKDLAQLAVVGVSQLEVLPEGDQVRFEFVGNGTRNFQLKTIFNAVFYNESGNIIGGCRNSTTLTDGTSVTFTCRVPPEAELDRTEIYAQLANGE